MVEKTEAGHNGFGKITAVTYPSTVNANDVVTAGPTYNYSYDGMYRLSGMTDSNNNTIVNNVSYNAADQLLTMNYPAANEVRGYNVLNQLTSLSTGSSENLTYNYPSGSNNGKISSMLPYCVFGRLCTANSNSFASFLLYEVGLNFGEPPVVPGWGILNP